MAPKKAAPKAKPDDLESLGLEGTSFADAQMEFPPRLIVCLHGPWFSGKSWFGLSGPGPIAVLNIDNNIEGVRQKFPDKRILSSEYSFKATVDPKFGTLAEGSTAVEAWERYHSDFRKVARAGGVRTIIMDKCDQAYDLCQLARLGRLQSVGQRTSYGPMKAEFREMLRVAKDDSSANLVMVHGIKKEYINDNWTGKWVRDGFVEAESFANVVGEMWKNKDGSGFCLKITKCTLNYELVDMDLGAGPGVLVGDMCNFKTLAGLALPEVDSDYWD